MTDDEWKRAPDNLMDAARLLAEKLNRKIWITMKPSGGAIKIPDDYWGISLEQDHYDGVYCVSPDGKVSHTEQYS